MGGHTEEYRESRSGLTILFWSEGKGAFRQKLGQSGPYIIIEINRDSCIFVFVYPYSKLETQNEKNKSPKAPRIIFFFSFSHTVAFLIDFGSDFKALTDSPLPSGSRFWSCLIQLQFFFLRVTVILTSRS